MTNQNIFIIVGSNSGDIYGVIETDKSSKIFQNEIDKWRKENQEVCNNWDDLKEYLIVNGYSLIEYEEVYF